jgi:predicted solute-binding protein
MGVMEIFMRLNKLFLEKLSLWRWWLKMTYPLPLSLEANFIYTLLHSKSRKGVLEALRDGQALEAVGLGDKDQDAIEELYSYLEESEG